MTESEKFGGLFKRIGDAVHAGAKQFKGKSILKSNFSSVSGDLIVYRILASDNGVDNFRKKDGFLVKDLENVILLQSGSLAGVAGSGVYELKKDAKTPGSEIIWVSKREFIVKWGSPGIYTADNILIGSFGISRLRVVNPRNFIMNVVSHRRKYSDDELRPWIKQTIIGAIKHVMSKYEIAELLRERKSLEMQMRSELGPELSRWGLELLGIEIGGFKVPDEYSDLLSYEMEKRALVRKRELDIERTSTSPLDIRSKIAKYEKMIEKADEKLLEGEISAENHRRIIKKYEDKISSLKSKL